MMRGLVRPLLLVAAVLFVPGAAYAQVGAIAGMVRDASGAVMPGVTVEVTSPALIEKVRSTITDDSGRYQITALPVGTYKVTFALQGFSTVERENVMLTSDFTANVNAQLAVGNITETVSVVAESPAVDVQNARVQYVFQRRRHRRPPDRARPGRPAEPGARRSRRTRERAPAASAPSATASPPPSTRTSPRRTPTGRTRAASWWTA